MLQSQGEEPHWAAERIFKESQSTKNCCYFTTSSTEVTLTLNILAAHSNCDLSLQIQI